jgi:hypothetical protein
MPLCDLRGESFLIQFKTADGDTLLRDSNAEVEEASSGS